MRPSEKLMNVSSRQLLAFLEVARLHSFSKAAEQIPMSQSGMSMLIKDLEEQMGARLFDRNPRSVALTDAGRGLVPVAQRIVDELKALGTMIEGSETAARSRLDIAATPIVAMSLLPDIVRALLDTHPQVAVSVADVELNAVKERVLNGEADVGLGFFVKPTVGLVRQSICRFRLMCISPPAGDGEQARASRAWSSLHDLPLLGLPSDNPIQSLVETHLARIGRGHEQRQTMNFMGTVIVMVRAGLGHAIIPSLAIEECKRHGLQVSMLVNPVVHLDLYLLSRRGSRPKPATLELIARLKAAAGGLAK
ncbi:LysR family transcriptional regulator [Burkholderia multivorans]|uniref:LysR family transcriptional regulator n=1 Tax=Burkholderia multivorans TaxID=87883 RepID=UPI001FC8EB4C|nr:LysR family transcriptional regulator [Burkholderia multivorans]MDN8008982.1 LysR family transcriptional regulator [Burkholderia multivorans]